MIAIDQYRFDQWCRRGESAYSTIGRAARLAPPLSGRGGWEGCFDGLHEPFKLDPPLGALACQLLSSLAVAEAIEGKGRGPIQQLARFARRWPRYRGLDPALSLPK